MSPNTTLLSNKITRIVLIGVLFVLFIIAYSGKVSAAYTPGRIIDDNIFLDANSMSANDIQNFLASKNSGLTTMKFALNCGSPSNRERQLYISAGAQCDTQIPASHIIYYAGQIYGVNPKVILSTMQKEQSLTTAPNPTVWQLTQAMGYACPTSGSCNTSSSFPYQIDNGTWALRYHFERARGNMNWWSPSTTWTCGTEKNLYKPNLYPNQNVNFYDTNGTYYTTVYIQNPATSSFYCYTPHAYNNPQGLYGRAPYGTAGLYYSGSYNFVLFYEQWFGSPSNPPPVKCDSKITGVVCVWSVRKGDGSQFLTTSESELNTTMYSFGWVNEGIILYALGGPNSNTVPVYRLRKDNLHYYTADYQEYQNLKNAQGWTDEGVRFYVYPGNTSTNVSHKVYRLYNPSNGYSFWSIDGQQKDLMLSKGYSLQGNVFNSLSGLIPIPSSSSGRNNIYSLRNGDTYLYSTDLVEVDSAIRNLRYQYMNILSTSNSASSGTPVYRLMGDGDFLYTTSTDERDSASRIFGYRYQGVKFYIDPLTGPIYRLIGTSASTHRYISNDKDLMNMSNKGWRYEKMLLANTGSITPVYRFLSDYYNNHYYTMDIAEATSMSNRSWKYEGIVFQSFNSASSGIPVYKLYSPGNHFYTTDINERNNAINKLGYESYGIAFYSSSSSTTVPVYRLYGKGEHFYTTNIAERDTAVSKYGYKYEGIVFYLPPGN